MATAPLKPVPVTISNLTATGFRATVTPPNNGGSAIDGYAIWISSTNDYNTATTYILTNPVTNVMNFTGLVQGRRYYVWGQARNGIAPFWGPLSDSVSAIPSTVPSAPKPVSYSNIQQRSVHAEFTATGTSNGGQAVTEWQLAYSQTNNISTATIIPFAYKADLTNLVAAGTYYFWGRGKNPIGYGAWSAVTSVTLRAGAKVNVAGTWKRALPYVRVGGVWKLAKPWVKQAGVWKEVL
jgi:hypothetical protein